MSNPVVVVPVFRGLAETRACIDSILHSRDENDRFDLAVVDDASPETAIVSYLDELAMAGLVRLIREPKNVGFVKAANDGMKAYPNSDAVLLNSDTVVSGSWLNRLRACAYSSPRVATATPFTNNGEICSFPLICVRNTLPYDLDCERLDSCFAACTGEAYAEIPTAVGFCMYIRRDCLEEIGYFDESAFGRGYGEENDFCMRAAKQGWTHLLCHDLFVEHRGGVSFGQDKQRLVERALRTIDAMHPHYHGRIASFIKDDPLEPYRARVLCEIMRCRDRPTVLMVSHGLGGGTWKHVRELIAACYGRVNTLLLRPSESDRVRLQFGDFEDAAALYFKVPEELDLLAALFRSLHVSRVHFHHCMALHEDVFAMPHRIGCPYDITLHDFHLLGVNPTLTDSNGRYTPDALAPAERLAGGRRFVAGAERVICPSRAAKSIMEQWFPEGRYVVALHPDHEAHTPYPGVCAPPIAAGQCLRVAVLGAVSREKGADLLEEVSGTASRADNMAFHLIGYAYRPLGRGVIEHGPYEDAELEDRLREVAPHVVWFPALCPETYSYTLSTCLKVGLPVVVPDIGAFAERVAGRPLSWCVPWGGKADDFVVILRAVRDVLASEGCRTLAWPPALQPYRNQAFYRHAYFQAMSEVCDNGGPLPLAAFRPSTDRARYGRNDRSGKIKRTLLQALIVLRAMPGLRHVVRFVPFGMQRAVKRWLDRAPIHDVLGPRAK